MEMEIRILLLPKDLVSCIIEADIIRLLLTTAQLHFTTGLVHQGASACFGLFLGQLWIPYKKHRLVDPLNPCAIFLPKKIVQLKIPIHNVYYVNIFYNVYY